MASRAWEFLLPSSGRHQVRGERLGKPEQKVYIDGVAQAGAALVFEGPGGCLLELRPDNAFKEWRLLCDGLEVEDYGQGKRTSGDPSLRELRGRPDGQYMIATDLDATGLNLNIVEDFPFVACDQKHLVQVAQTQNIWEVIFDGHIMERFTGQERGTNAEVSFSVKLGVDRTMDAVLRIMWVKWPVPAGYRYRLALGGVNVPRSAGPRIPVGRLPAGVEGLPVILPGSSEKASAVFLPGVEGEYLVDNRSYRATTIGLCYRFNKDLNSRNADRIEPWGSMVSGIADDEGWLRIGDQYLPMMLDGLPVLTLMQAAEEMIQQSEAPVDSAPAGEALSPSAQMDALPQGVSFDRETGRYKATVRSKTGQFVDLGDHDSAEAAHQKYLEALHIYNPNKAVAPMIPGS